MSNKVIKQQYENVSKFHAVCWLGYCSGSCLLNTESKALDTLLQTQLLPHGSYRENKIKNNCNWQVLEGKKDKTAK